ncbi:MAG: hypothetical protein AB1656_20900 [Candidatus Omnitrophota bacterium]
MESKRRKKLLIMAMILCFSLLAADRLAVTPLQNLWKARSERIAELERSVNKGLLLVSREEAIKDSWRSMMEKDLSDALSDAQSQVLKSYDRWAEASQLSMTSLTPRWIEEDDSIKLECRAAGIGGIGAIARFLYELECDPLALKVEEITISSKDENGQNLTFSVAFSGVRLLEVKNETNTKSVSSHL